MMDTKKGIWERVHRAIDESTILTLKTYSYLPRERRHIDGILGAFLEASGLAGLRDDLSYCVHELAGNAKKANIKRLYFRRRRLDILDPLDYTRGMETFKCEMTQQIEHYLARLRESGLYVKFQFCRVNNGVKISIRNNSELTPDEQRRIGEKVAVASRSTCLAEAYSETEETEGAGLGIVMMLFMLKSLGFPPDVFSIDVEGGETIATLDLFLPSFAATGRVASA